MASPTEPSPAIVVLFVDDHEDTRTAIAEQLASAGMFAIVVSQAADARTALATERVDVIVTDVTLGGESGIQMMLEIRKDPEHRDIPAIVASGTHRREEIEDEHPGLFQAVLEKPFPPGDLITAIQTILAAR